MSKSKVLFIMTGSIACYKACHVISRLVQNQCDVQVVATPAALQFVGNATLEGLSGKPVISDMYAAGNVMEHIHLMRWADLILVAPGTANFINKAAQGVGDDLVQTLFLAHDFKRPFLVAPAMNTSMYSHPVTQNSLQALKKIGIQILDSASGILACGEEGWGRLLEPDIILDYVLKSLKNSTPTQEHTTKKSFKELKVLVTAGGTQEPIDTVRSITNTSTGKTGIAIAEALTHFGIETVLLKSQNAPENQTIEKQSTFLSFQDLDLLLKETLSGAPFTHVIHAAAVSDYSLTKIESNGQNFNPKNLKKISSQSEEVILHLKRNHKIVDRLKDYSVNKNLKVVAFKLTSHASAEERSQAVNTLLKSDKVDYVVHNDLDDIDVKNNSHSFTFFNSQESKSCENLNQLINQLVQVLLPKESL